VTHGDGDLALEPDSSTGAAVAGDAPMMTELVAGASSSQAQPGAVTPETLPTVNAIITAGSGVPEVLPTEDASFAGGGTATTGDNDGDGNELEVVLRHPNF
jgi:hypothetical protein